MRCLYSNCLPVFGHVIAFNLVYNTSIPCINDFMSTSPVSSYMIASISNGGIFSFVRGSSIWFLFSIICFFSTCCIKFRVGYLCVVRPSGLLYVLSLTTLKLYEQLSLLFFIFILFLRFCVEVSLSSSMIFGPTLCYPGMFGGVTLLLSCDLASEAFFSAELIMSDICCSPEKFDR